MGRGGGEGEGMGGKGGQSIVVQFLLATSCRLLLLKLYTLEIGKGATEPSLTWAAQAVRNTFQESFSILA